MRDLAALLNTDRHGSSLWQSLLLLTMTLVIGACQQPQRTDRNDGAIELARIEVSRSPWADSSAYGRSPLLPKIEFKIASLEPQSNRSLSHFGPLSYYVEDESIFGAEDILGLSLQKQSRKELASTLHKELQQIPQSLVQSNLNKPVYYVVASLTSLGKKMYKDALQKHQDKLILVTINGKALLAATTIAARVNDNPVFFMGQMESLAQAEEQFQALKRAIFPATLSADSNSAL